MIDLNIQFDNQNVTRRLTKLQADLGNLKEALLKSKDFVLRETDKQFDTKGSNLGTAWKERTKPYSWPILQKTGKMRRAFTYKPLSPKTGVTMYNKLENSYFKYHQSSQARRKLPRRQMFVLNDKMRKGILDIFNQYLHKITR